MVISSQYLRKLLFISLDVLVFIFIESNRIFYWKKFFALLLRQRQQQQRPEAPPTPSPTEDSHKYLCWDQRVLIFFWQHVCMCVCECGTLQLPTCSLSVCTCVCVRVWASIGLREWERNSRAIPSSQLRQATLRGRERVAQNVWVLAYACVRVCVRASVLMSEREARAAATTGVRDSRFKDTKTSTEGWGIFKKKRRSSFRQKIGPTTIGAKIRGWTSFWNLEKPETVSNEKYLLVFLIRLTQNSAIHAFDVTRQLWSGEWRGGG